MTSLSQAQTLAGQIDYATQQFEAYIRPSLQEFIDFLPELGTMWLPEKYTKAEDYSFTEVEGKHFNFESAEWYEYGEYTKDTIALPFAFVEDPEAYVANEREKLAVAAKKHTEAQRARAAEKVARLEAQLEAAKTQAGL